MKKLFLIAALAMAAIASAPAHAANFRLCTGNSQLNYFKAGQYLKVASTSVAVDVIETKGSLDNLDKLSNGQCDGAFVQSDAMLVYSSRNSKAISGLERAGILYQEQVHMVCNRKLGISRMVDLNKSNTVAVGPDGSGGRTTWDAFILADKARYSVVGTDPRSGVRAFSAVAEGTQVQCAMVVTALNAPLIKNDAQKEGDNVVLVGTDDRDMTRTAKDGRGNAVYTYGEIPAGTYPRIQPSGTVYGTKAIGTVQVDAIFVASTAFIEANEADYDKLLRSFAAAKPQIQKLAQPQ
ncbi:TAXI family TRAP transporter solute-binding subunit [Bradyrhizobium ottawaense]|uniref:TRAP transporter substrate-binding protein n=1 Tax=Bradyrhizobium ottawaense TaxID=931866 RepID=A0ABY0QHM0_9BRAD|nr:TAXI family TRAP transporter solute-binding subunit [Bradyrhizobium ottawaense]SDH37905.1 hypothetical protein SAMN05444163_0013 [Bradyrhizobium ottawaense]SDK46232.1 hypothetical protein SAMN05444163_8172 [Bradyrhizobium ottawaense]